MFLDAPCLPLIYKDISLCIDTSSITNGTRQKNVIIITPIPSFLNHTACDMYMFILVPPV